MNKKIGIIAGLALSLAVTVTGCTESVDQKQSQQQEQMQQDMQNRIGLPNIKNWTEKKLAKEILELRDNPKLITYVYTETMDGHFVYIGQALGFGLPYSTQYTNPARTSDVNSAAVIPQADPNGLFSPSSANATWVQLIDEKTGQREVIYMEPNTVVTQYKLPKNLLEPWSVPSNY